MVLRKAYIEEDIEAAVCSNHAYRSGCQYRGTPQVIYCLVRGPREDTRVQVPPALRVLHIEIEERLSGLVDV